jgi:hypothetical protein
MRTLQKEAFADQTTVKSPAEEHRPPRSPENLSIPERYYLKPIRTLNAFGRKPHCQRAAAPLWNEKIAFVRAVQFR